jgi:hypothetical protein
MSTDSDWEERWLSAVELGELIEVETDDERVPKFSGLLGDLSPESHPAPSVRRGACAHRDTTSLSLSGEPLVGG